MLILCPFSQYSKSVFFFPLSFGSKIVSAQTGIILNDSMDDFSVPDVENAFHIPPSPANFIRPQKMPMSSMCPTILLDENNDVEVLIGAAGGSRITSSVAYVST